MLFHRYYLREAEILHVGCPAQFGGLHRTRAVEVQWVDFNPHFVNGWVGSEWF